MKIPQQGLEQQALFNKLEDYRENDIRWREGRIFGYVYDAGEEAEIVVKKAFAKYMSENALDPTVYPSLLRLENEVVAMSIDHLGGDENAVGTFTSGGTESIILSVKTARDHARAERSHITRPNMVLPSTAHAAFHKAAHYLDVEIKQVSVDPKTFTPKMEEIEAAVDENTILLVGSAPSYAHGVIDPIEAMGKLALEKNLLLHVDGCIGAFLLPYFKRLGADIPSFDLKTPGVTSISMDLHKYAYAAKGASILVHKDKALRKHQIFSCASWTGYTVVNTTVQSTKSGGPIAGAWAVLNHFGDEGYLKIARGLKTATQTVLEGIEEIDDLYLLGEPKMSLLAFASDTIDVFKLADEMKTKGWYLQPQLGFEDCKENIHLSINPSNVPHMEALMSDLKETVAALKAEQSPAASMDGLTQMLASGDVEMNEETFAQLLQMVGIQGVQLPEKMAEINGLLNALPPKLKEQMLTTFVNDLFIAKEG